MDGLNIELKWNVRSWIRHRQAVIAAAIRHWPRLLSV